MNNNTGINSTNTMPNNSLSINTGHSGETTRENLNVESDKGSTSGSTVTQNNAMPSTGSSVGTTSSLRAADSEESQQNDNDSVNEPLDTITQDQKIKRQF